MIRAVLADLGGVLLHNDWKDVAAHWEAELGLPPGGFLHALYSGNDDTVLIGRVAEDAWWDEVCRRLGGDTALRARIEALFDKRERCDAEMVRFLSSLRPAYRVALVSNAWPSACARARTRWNLHEVCDAMIFSCEVGVAKPQAEIYWIACERLGVVPAEVVFIDDGRDNVEAAAALGMRVVLFDETWHAIDAVRRLLVGG